MLLDLFSVFSKKHFSFVQRTKLCFFVIKLRIAWFFLNRFFDEKRIKKISGLGYSINLNTFSEFYWTFREVFLEEEYYFEHKNGNPHILDCGGHIGVSALYFKWLYPEAKLTIFEPLPENFDLLQKNIAENSLTDISLQQRAVADQESELSFAGDGRAGHLVTDQDTDTITVKTVKLSNFITEPVAFCKMDIEGAESAVITELEMAGTLSNIDKLVMEYHQQDNNSLGSIITNFEKQGFKVSFNSTLNPLKLSPRDFSHMMLVAVKK